MLDFPKFQSSETHLGKFPDSMEFQSYKVNFKTEVCPKSADPQLTMQWIKEVEIAKSIGDLLTSRSITGRTDFPDCDMLDGAQRAHCVLPTLVMRVTYPHGSSVCKKVFAHVSCLSISPSPFSCLTHLLLSPYYDSLYVDFPVHTFLPYLPVLKAQGMRISARGREVWLSGQVRPQHRL